MDLLLKEKSISVYIKLLDPIVSQSGALTRVESMRIEDDFNVKRQQVERKKFLLWHQQADKTRVDRNEKLHSISTCRYYLSCSATGIQQGSSSWDTTTINMVRI